MIVYTYSQLTGLTIQCGETSALMAELEETEKQIMNEKRRNHQSMKDKENKYYELLSNVRTHREKCYIVSDARSLKTWELTSSNIWSYA